MVPVMNHKTAFTLDGLLACQALANTPLQGVLRSAALAVQQRAPRPDTNSSPGEEKKWNHVGVTSLDYAAGAKAMTLLRSFVCFCSSPFSAEGPDAYRDGSKQTALSEACLEPWIPLPAWIPNTLPYFGFPAWLEIFAHFVTSSRETTTRTFYLLFLPKPERLANFCYFFFFSFCQSRIWLTSFQREKPSRHHTSSLMAEHSSGRRCPSLR